MPSLANVRGPARRTPNQLVEGSSPSRLTTPSKHVAATTVHTASLAVVTSACHGGAMTLSATRLYASSIAIVSGLYSLDSALGGVMGGTARNTGDFIMIAIGVIVIVHGFVLLTPAAARLGQANGPLMMLWGLIMLGNQLLFADVPGMAAIAVLMLISGLIMSVRPPESGM
jgi:hypothetical protein